MMLTRNQRRQMERLAPHVEQITDTDRAFFEQHPDRRHRVRLTGEAEIAQLEIQSGGLLHPPKGCRWFTVVRKMPGARLRIFVLNAEGAQTGLEVPEDLADAIFDTAAPQDARDIEARLSACMEARK